MKKKLSKILAFIVICTMLLPVLGRMKSIVTVIAAEPQLNKSSVELIEGEDYDLSVKNLDESSVDSITWKANRTSVVTVTADGKITAEAAGSTTVKCTITYKDSTTKILSCSVKVKTPSGGVALDATSKSILVGDTLQLKTKNLDSTKVKLITWKSNNKSVATVSENGLVTAVMKGSTDIKCTIIYNDGTKKTLVCYVTVKEDVAVTSIKLSGIMIGDNNAVNMYVGDTVTANATLVGSKVTDKIIWTSKHPHIATVQDGKVIAKKMGITAIAATAGDVSEEFFVNIMETEKLIATPTPTDTSKEDSINSEWISVDGGWEFKIDSVEVHELCNKYSDKNNSAQCIIVTYSYKNTGFYGYKGEDSLYISDRDIDVYDEEGVKAETYPCTHTKLPAKIISGTKCSKAQAAYALENTSNEITLVVEIYRYDISKSVTQKFNINIGADEDFSTATSTTTSTPTLKPANTFIPTPTPIQNKSKKIEENFNILKEYISTHGETDNDGNKYLECCFENDGDFVMEITYNAKKDIYSFSVIQVDEKTSACLLFEWGQKQYKSTTVRAILIVGNSEYVCKAEATLDGKTYCGEDLDFIITGSLDKGEAFETKIVSMLNILLKMGMFTFDEILLPQCGINMSDIGFERFNVSDDGIQGTNIYVDNVEPTTSQQQAVKKAKSYLNSSAFSYEGLMDQLEYEGFTEKEAKYGVDNCGADWYEQAVKKAKSYLNSSAFSYEGLIDQLEYEGFTEKEAKYGVDNCGADWYEQAVKKAASYLRSLSFSRLGLIEQLEYEGFTYEQAVYGVKQNGL